MSPAANEGLKLGYVWVGCFGYYQFFVFSWFPSHPGSTFRGANFGISLCLWIELDKRPLISSQSSTPPFPYSHSFSFSFFLFSIWEWGGGLWSLIKRGEMGSLCVCVGGCLSGTVKCNPKSTASSSTTILMEMGNILYQGNHILLEMTVSKVGVDTMATKQLFASEASRREGRLSDRRG